MRHIPLSRRSLLAQTGAVLSGFVLSGVSSTATASSKGAAKLPAAAAGTLRIGRDLTVNRLGFGAMRICGDGIWGDPADPVEARAVLRRAVELGVNFIDTADAYGPYVSENLIAEVLSPYPKGLLVATKGGLVRPVREKWDRDGRPEHLREACEASLKRLKIERIDLYQMHAPDPKVPYEDSIGELAKLQKEGKIRHIGLSNVPCSLIEQALERTPIVTVQNMYNVNGGGGMLAKMAHAEVESPDSVLDLCERRGIAYLPFFPLVVGNLGQHRGLAEVAKRHGKTPAQISVAWLLARSKVMLPIPGTSSPEHLEENWAAREIALSAEDMATIAQG